MPFKARRPEVKKLEIGDTWLLVKKHLTSGEQRAVFARMMRTGEAGDSLDSTKVGLSRVVGYLLDWNVTDADDKPLVIQDQPEDTVIAALNALDPEDFSEILGAIEAHHDAMVNERRQEKKLRAGETTSSTTS